MSDPMQENQKSETQNPPANVEAQTVLDWAYHNLLKDKTAPFPCTNPVFNFLPLSRGAKLVPIEKNEPMTTQQRLTLGEMT
jgi:hypothetical protein